MTMFKEGPSAVRSRAPAINPGQCRSCVHDSSHDSPAAGCGLNILHQALQESRNPENWNPENWNPELREAMASLVLVEESGTRCTMWHPRQVEDWSPQPATGESHRNGRAVVTRTAPTAMIRRTWQGSAETDVEADEGDWEPQPAAAPAGQPVTGYCIRCADGIPYNFRDPLCPGCLKVWRQYRNRAHPEHYCHSCGERHATSMARPMHHQCYQRTLPHNSQQR